MKPDQGREHMMEPKAPATIGPPEAEECERCGEPAERRARFWMVQFDFSPDDDLDGDDPDDDEFLDFDLCDTCFLLWKKSADMTPEQSMAFWLGREDGDDD